jgi:glucan 1,3-beta-glucosidase
MEKSIQMRLGTVLMGDPTDLPTLKAVSRFAHSHIIYAKDPTQPGTNNFYIAIKNLIIDSTDFDKDKTIYHIDWTVSQATQLTNIVFNMPNYSTGHAGVTAALNYPNDGSGYNSALILNDLTFNGGATGMVLNGQQYILKGMTFNGCNTGIRVNGFDLVVHNSSFSYCTTGIDAHGISGSLTVLDTVATNIGTLVHSTDSHNARNSIILENVINNGNTVVLDDSTIPPLVGSVLDTWIHGNLVRLVNTSSIIDADHVQYAPRNKQPQFQAGQSITAARLSALTVDGNSYFAMKPPTYEDFAVDQVVNVKTVANLPVRGDGNTDDTANINAVLLKSVGKLVYFPAGTYIVTDSLVIPPESRIVGDAYASSISAAFSPRFNNPDAPTAMVKLGNPGDVGVGQISDMLFTVSDVLPGCKLVSGTRHQFKPAIIANFPLARS